MDRLPTMDECVVRTLVVGDRGDLTRVVHIGLGAARADGDAPLAQDRQAVPGSIFDIDVVPSSKEALHRIRAALRDRLGPYALVIVDGSSPGPLDSLTFIQSVWRVLPWTQIIVTAHDIEVSLRAIHARFGPDDRLVCLAQPVGSLALRQSASVLIRRWLFERDARASSARQARSADDHTKILHRKLSDLTHQKRQLAQAKYHADSASQAKSRFVSAISHEIRTPLNGILGMLSLLEASELTAEQAENLRVAVVSGEALVRLLNDALDFSKIEAGRMTIERVEFDLFDLLQSVTDTLRPAASKQNVELQWQSDAPRWRRLVGDPGRLRQILINLIANAIRFTAEGRVTVRVSVIDEAETDRAQPVRFDVTDTGVGIEPHAIARIFDAFSQAEASTTRLFGGTGLGLTICKQLVELMNGTIGVDSTVGQGSTFWFAVPLSRVDATDRPSAAEPPPKTTALEPSAICGASILVVEDNVVNQRVAARLLERLGCRVTIAEDGQRGVEFAARETFDLIFMDFEMPRLDGLAAAAQIRAAETSQHRVPIVALTAHAFDDVKRRCLDAGMDDHLAKPIRLPELMDTLLRWLPDEDARRGS